MRLWPFSSSTETTDSAPEAVGIFDGSKEDITMLPREFTESLPREFTESLPREFTEAGMIIPGLSSTPNATSAADDAAITGDATTSDATSAAGAASRRRVPADAASDTETGEPSDPDEDTVEFSLELEGSAIEECRVSTCLRHRRLMDEPGHNYGLTTPHLRAERCPAYVPLQGPWASQWGAIMAPQSVKFGKVVDAQEWCGCPGGHADEELREVDTSSPRSADLQTPPVDETAAPSGGDSMPPRGEDTPTSYEGDLWVRADDEHPATSDVDSTSGTAESRPETESGAPAQRVLAPEPRESVPPVAAAVQVPLSLTQVREVLARAREREREADLALTDAEDLLLRREAAAMRATLRTLYTPAPKRQKSAHSLHTDA